MGRQIPAGCKPAGAMGEPESKCAVYGLWAMGRGMGAVVQAAKPYKEKEGMCYVVGGKGSDSDRRHQGNRI